MCKIEMMGNARTYANGWGLQKKSPRGVGFFVLFFVFAGFQRGHSRHVRFVSCELLFLIILI